MLIGYELGSSLESFASPQSIQNGRLMAREVGFAVGLITTVGVTLSVTGIAQGLRPSTYPSQRFPSMSGPLADPRVLTEIFSGVVL